MYKNHFNASQTNSSTVSAYIPEKFTRYTIRTEDCPICSSHDGRCKTTGNGLTLCMERGKDDVPESILNRWDYRGLNKTQEWHLWADKEHPSFNNSGKGFDANSTSKKKGSQATKKVLTLHPNVLDSIYRGIAKEIGLSDRAKQDLVRRGIDPDKYLVKKVKEDAQVYAETIFLQRMTRKNFLTQLKQVDNGDSSARMHEVVNQSISQIRDNIKFAQSQRTDLEKYYRDMRKDYDRMMENIKQTKIEQGIETKADGKIVDARSLNDMIEKMIKNRD